MKQINQIFLEVESPTLKTLLDMKDQLSIDRISLNAISSAQLKYYLRGCSDDIFWDGHEILN